MRKYTVYKKICNLRENDKNSLCQIRPKGLNLSGRYACIPEAENKHRTVWRGTKRVTAVNLYKVKVTPYLPWVVRTSRPLTLMTLTEVVRGIYHLALTNCVEIFPLKIISGIWNQQSYLLMNKEGNYLHSSSLGYLLYKAYYTSITLALNVFCNHLHITLKSCNTPFIQLYCRGT